ncbi:xanthine dehydrogenase FAD-binding subunit XdhB [Mesoterricola sediminis]|uniref:Xanthine dehydrogenase FAD-binding subunit XdhB n=1 Tax=Mesoterricola sediminis TaxID=2927980 RepID=A0AA48KC38_9BACT|nr:xanthine dehydrogenase FAD-binding subunit XdhB [Mesoterricola sediminis]BDU76759.1 xanthine dehydrogenase FAD-binding subunit XdhB [Mesoterricola sediminis]
MFDICELHEPATLREAKERLQAAPDLRVVAGGTDVLIRLQHGHLAGAGLLSLRRVPGLDAIRMLDDGTLEVGAMAPFTRIFEDPLVRAHAPVLAEASVSMGGPQIRNVATIGGNICNGAVSADSASTLFALDALLRLETLEDARVIPIADFYAGPGKVNLRPGELLTAVLIPREGYAGMGGHYIKYAMRKAMDIATLGVAALAKVREGRFVELRIGLGVAAPVPIRCAEAEAWAPGKQVTLDTLAEIAALAVKPSRARTSWRASKDYREHLIEVLVQRAVAEAVKRAGDCCAD